MTPLESYSPIKMIRKLSLHPDFQKWNTVVLPEKEGPDSFYRSSFESWYTVYQREQTKEGTFIGKDFIVSRARMELADELRKPVDETILKSGRFQGNSQINFRKDKQLVLYDLLSDGMLAEYSKTHPEYSIESLMDGLRKGYAPVYGIFELFSETFAVDIYIIDDESKDVYVTGYERFFQKGRSGYVLYLTRREGLFDHYDLVGVQGKMIETYFLASNPFIVFLKERIGSRK